jgi:hypothetical protein
MAAAWHTYCCHCRQQTCSPTACMAWCLSRVAAWATWCLPLWMSFTWHLVAAVGVLNVLGMHPGDPGAPSGDCAGVVLAAGPGVALQPGVWLGGGQPGHWDGVWPGADGGSTVPDEPGASCRQGGCSCPPCHYSKGAGSHSSKQCGGGYWWSKGPGAAAVQLVGAAGCVPRGSPGPHC